jgi:2-oxoisovalerate dehydrogenase E1 component
MLWAEKETGEPVVPIPLGSARRCLEGNDLTLVAWGNTMEKAYEAIAALKGTVGVDLIDLRSIAPWDHATIEASVRKTGRLIVVQEDGEACSVGQMIITHILGQADLWAGLKAPPLLVAKPNVMIGYNPIYEYAALPDAARIVEAIERTVGLDLTRGQALPVPATEASQLAATPAAQAHGPQNTVIAGTNDIIVRVPIMGEGLRSARVVSLAKQPGDVVQHDDILCEVETDKAVYPIEASFAGRLKRWQIKVDDTVLIGQAIALVTGDALSVAALPVEAGAESPAVASPRAPISPLVASGPTVAPQRAAGCCRGCSYFYPPSIHDRKSSPAGS